jgi:hypothetical protein
MFPILAGNSASTGYNLTRSLRFRASASAYLNRTPSVAGNLTTWTWSSWIKRGTLSASGYVFGAGTVATNDTGLYFETDNTLVYFKRGSINLQTSQVFRDISSWYHIVVVYDSTQGTASNRLKMYVNGTQVTAFATSTYPTASETTQTNNNVLQFISRRADGVYFDGYLAEVNFIDGQALTPSSFGSTNALTGVWQPARYTGAYGTNGFYLPFTDNSTAAALGTDFSGNSNTWTTNNISITAGVTYDSMTDVPTLTSATAANFCTWSPLASTSTISQGNLLSSTSGGSTLGSAGTFGMASDKWYCEFTITSFSAGTLFLGIEKAAFATYPDVSFANGYAYRSDGQIRKLGVDSAYGASYSAGTVIAFAFDATNNTITFYRNNVSQGQVTGLSASTYVPYLYFAGVSVTAQVHANFGQQPFTYTPPTGFVALNTFNLPTSTIAVIWSVKGQRRSTPLVICLPRQHR